MAKSFWTVSYRKWGSDTASMEIFDSKEDAEYFYNSIDYVNKPRHHTASTDSDIERWEKRVYQTKEDLILYNTQFMSASYEKFNELIKKSYKEICEYFSEEDDA